MAMLCSDCFRGTLRGDVVPAGTEETIHGRPTYVARPEPGVDPIGTVVIIPDAFGWTLRNTRALADAYARRVPCVVYVPDFMDGHALPEWSLNSLESKPAADASILTRVWHSISTSLVFARIVVPFYLHNRPAAALPRIREWFRALRTEQGADAKISVAGFCWGGLFTVLLTHDDAENLAAVSAPSSAQDQGEDHPELQTPAQFVPVIDCAFTAHPALVKVPEHIDKAVRPLSVANGDDDEWMGREAMQQLVAIIELEKNRGVPQGEERFEAVVYPGATHGFAVRGDRDDPKQRERGEQTLDGRPEIVEMTSSLVPRKD
ncbi:hypothetical protein VTJ49DRAFT_4311 [Mycothermus thermophilus]|uniref:Dienelactone hydrolase domain-containing protein n=1 Tax=Humicola insolens TaxID=85995 RepID=A0ABR3V5P6_HUMIN